MKRVLLAPLDWGLGHATRCVPLIRELEYQGCDVIIAGNGNALELLKKEFPGHSFHILPAYAPRYPADGSMVFAMAAQLPRFLRVISSEHDAVEDIVEREKIDVIISDNRYGCWSKKVPSVFITHQSNILMPKRFGFLQWPVRKLSELIISRFDRCWIPDYPESDSLAGALVSYGRSLSLRNVDFIGWLSRFEGNVRSQAPERDVLVICSGPEPQRTLFEEILMSQLKGSGLTFRLVRGLPSAAACTGDERFANFLTARELQSNIETSSIVVARSGYSTVMDMHALGKKVVFVPTPGQTEQEYLARRLMENGIAFSMPQNEFDLATALAQSKFYSGFSTAQKNNLLRQAVEKLLKAYV